MVPEKSFGLFHGASLRETQRNSLCNCLLSFYTSVIEHSVPSAESFLLHKNLRNFALGLVPGGLAFRKLVGFYVKR